MLIKNYNQEKFVIRNANTIMNHFVNFHNNFEIFVSGPKFNFLACQDLLRTVQRIGVKFKPYKLDGADQTAMAYRPFGTLHLSRHQIPI